MSKVKFEKAKVLLAEDNRLNQEVCFEMLKMHGIITSIVNDGDEAFKAFQNNRFDLIFMDYHMPNMSGFEAAQAIRNYEKLYNLAPTPIIAFTASVLESDLEKCSKYGMDDYLIKPVDKNSLVNILLKWLN